MIRIFAALWAWLAIMGAASAAPGDDLHALFDDYWANEMAENPFSATGSGVSGYEDKVPSVTPEDQARRTAQAAGRGRS